MLRAIASTSATTPPVLPPIQLPMLTKKVLHFSAGTDSCECTDDAPPCYLQVLLPFGFSPIQRRKFGKFHVLVPKKRPTSSPDSANSNVAIARRIHLLANCCAWFSEAHLAFRWTRAYAGGQRRPVHAVEFVRRAPGRHGVARPHAPFIQNVAHLIEYVLVAGVFRQVV